MTASETKILTKIREWLGPDHSRYDFWFVYGGNGHALNFEGGFELGQSPIINFRNEYSIMPDGTLAKNWRQGRPPNRLL